MKAKSKGTLFRTTCLLAILASNPAKAEQPVMGMVPRWDGGYGLQTFWFYRDSSMLLDGSRVIDNENLLNESESKTSFEGVYTWDRSVRVTFKMPYLEKTLTEEVNGQLRHKSASGWGDLKLALPLKRYFNKEGYSGNWSLTPQVKLPTGNDDGPIKLGSGEIDYALGASFERETPHLLYNYGLTYWKNGGSAKRGKWELESLIAWNFATDKFIGIDIEGDWEHGSSARRLEAGPSFFWWIEKTVLMKIGYKRIIDERVNGISLSSGDEFRIGIGFVR